MINVTMDCCTQKMVSVFNICDLLNTVASLTMGEKMLGTAENW